MLRGLWLAGHLEFTGLGFRVQAGLGLLCFGFGL